MKVSIVVPAFNEEKLLPQTLPAIQSAADAFRSLGWETELIVCDNNSTDRTAEIAVAAGARVVFEPVNQIARARNAGAGVASGDWLVFVDADSEPSAGLFSDAGAAIASGRYVAGGAVVRLDEPSWLLGFFSGLWNWISRTKKWCAGSFIFCRATAFREIGGFSSELYVSEELDLSQRLQALARREGKDLVILTKHPLKTSARKMQLYGHRGHLLFLLRVLLGGAKVLRTREQCHLWYDGKR